MFWFTSRIHKQRVIPVFRGGKRPYIEACTRPRKDRNPVPEAEEEGQPAFAVFFEGGTVYSLQRAESRFRSFSRYPVPFFDPSRRARKNRNDFGLGLFVMKNDDAFLLRRRRHFFRVKSRMKPSNLLGHMAYKKQEVESSYGRNFGVRKPCLRFYFRLGIGFKIQY